MRPSTSACVVSIDQNSISSYLQKGNNKQNTRQYPMQSQRVHDHEPVCIIGHPSLRVKKFQLPPHLLHLLDYIVNGCDNFATTLPGGWMTYLYSLTKQDIALRDVPEMYKAASPIISYVKSTIKRMYNFEQVKIDRNQPHVLRYSASAEGGCKHTGVELHHDKCDLTVNIMMVSRSLYCSFYHFAQTLTILFAPVKVQLLRRRRHLFP